MAHHQGMSLLAFEHVLLDQPMQRRFMSDPLVRATELLLQERVPKQGATLHPHAAEVSAAAAPRRRGSRRDHARVYRPEHADTRSSPVVQRQVPRHGDPCRRRLQPLARPGGHPLARGRHVRWLGHIHLPARPRHGALLVDRLSTDTAQGRSATRRSSCRRAPNTGGAIRRSRRTPRSAFHRKTTSRSAASRSPTVVRDPSYRGDELRGGRIGAVECRPGPSQLSATCSCKPKSCPIGRRFSARGAAAHPGSRCRGCSTCWRRLARLPTSRPTRPIAPGSSGGVERRPTRVVLDGGDGPSVIRRLSNTEGSVLDPIVAIRRTLSLSPDESATVQIISGCRGHARGGIGSAREVL